MDEAKKAQLKELLRKNQNRLRDQMKDNEEKMRYDILMTEHERKVNDDDIEAYQNQEFNIYGKLPGFGGSHERERQTSLVNNNLGRMGGAGNMSK